MGRKRMKGIKGVEEMKSHHRNKTTEEPRQISSLWGSPSRVVIDGQDGLGLDILPRRCDDTAKPGRYERLEPLGSRYFWTINGSGQPRQP